MDSAQIHFNTILGVMGETVGGDDGGDGDNGGGFVCSVAEILALFFAALQQRRRLKLNLGFGD